LLAPVIVILQSANSQWTIERNDSSTFYQQVIFVDSLHGYIAGDGVLSTTDAGKNWNQAKTNSFMRSLAVVNKFLWASSDIGEVYRSQDSGKTLNLQFMDAVPYDFHTVAFTDTLRGWLFGNAFGSVPSGDIILHTTDGGKTWATQYELDQPPSTPGQLRQGFFVDSLHGWACIDLAILHTFNGGKDWIGQGPPGGFLDLYSVFFIDTSRGWVIGTTAPHPTGYIAFTTDGGENWIQGKSSLNSTPRSVFFTDSINGWVCCNDGEIAHSTDGGRNWMNQQSNTSNSLESIFFLNKNNGWAVGDYGLILHTTNGGGTTSVPIRTQTPITFSLSHNFPNPFNPTTTIRYAIPVKGNVNLSVFDLLGNRIAVLQNGPQDQGEFEKVFDAKGLSSGIYIYRITYYHDGITQVSNQKMLLLK